ncbi:MAG: 4a-hydroxytetrahydrobiopterin dehydratase [Cycloclasticus sp.]
MSLQQATQADIEQFLQQQPEWQLRDGKLYRNYLFSNFIEAFAFMTEVALYAEKANHHPEWFNVYRTVCIELTTHEVSAVSERDFQLANQMESLAEKRLTDR